MLRLHTLSAFRDNYIWALSDHAGNSVIVDPGDAQPVFAAAARGLRPKAILLTHHHDDHVGGVTALCERWPLRCIGPSDERARAEERVSGGERVELKTPAASFDVLAVPGHTVSLLAFYTPGRVFCGDTLFSLGCGRLFEGTPAEMLDSLDRLAALPGDTGVCCGHEYTEANGRFATMVDPGNDVLKARLDEVTALRAAGQPSVPSRIDSERACNPFLRVDTPAIQDAIARRCGVAPRGRVEAFAALRRWKDEFAG